MERKPVAAPIRVNHRVRINRPVEHVYSFALDPTNISTWDADITDVPSRVQPLTAGASFDVMFRFPRLQEARCDVGDVQPNRKVVLRIASPPLDVVLTYLFEPSDGGTLVTREIEVEPKGVYTMMNLMSRDMLRRGSLETLDNLKTLLEG